MEDKNPAANADVAIIGLGYVGLTLAVALADQGVKVIGYDANPAVVAGVGRGEPPFWEHNLAELLRDLPPGQLEVSAPTADSLPKTVVICVGTPLDDTTKTPDLSHLESSVEMIAEHVTSDTLVMLRSTVPVGTSRELVIPALQKRVREPMVAFCPERTIQGQALRELRELPQIVGANNDRARQRAEELFGRLGSQVVQVSSLEAAEMVKLICNAHTDLIYGFGNEVALIAEAIGLDANELIRSANLNYPRPDLSRPGFVGGSCLVKDPYILIESAKAHGYSPPMVTAARQLNEQLPHHVAQRILDALSKAGRRASDAKVLISGIAYKGRPATDDVRGGAAEPIGSVLRGTVGTVVGHDFVVSPERIAGLGLEPVSLEDGFANADAALILTDHARYGAEDVHGLVSSMRTPIVFDAWGVFDERFRSSNGLTYVRLGSGR